MELNSDNEESLTRLNSWIFEVSNEIIYYNLECRREGLISLFRKHLKLNNIECELTDEMVVSIIEHMVKTIKDGLDNK